MIRLMKFWIVLLLFLPLSAIADEAGLYRDGVDAFKAGKYEQALTCFQQALARENQSPGLFYNIGVTCYKTGRYGQAADAFGRLVENPAWGPLALYNLGLTAEADGRRDAAVDYYTKAKEKAHGSRIASLAALKLAYLRGDGQTETSPWYGVISLSGGYDDNALLAPDDDVVETAQEADSFINLYVAAGKYLTGGWDSGIRLDGGVFACAFSDETDYNTVVMFAGISRDRQHDKWRTHVGATVDIDFDDDGYYATTPAVKLAAERVFEHDSLRFYNILYWIEAGDPYAYLTGIKNRSGAEASHRISRGRVFTGCEFEYNDREDLSFEDAYFNYSPLRVKVSAGVDYRLALKWRLLLRGDFRKSMYPDVNIEIIEDISITQDKREDDRWNVSARIKYGLKDNLGIFGEYRYTNNDSNFARYDYTSNQVTSGIVIAY